MQETDTEVNALAPAREFGNGAQWRLIGLIAAGLVAAILLYFGIRALLAPAPPPPDTTPPGEVRLTGDQMSALTVQPAQVGGTVELVRASGSIAADGDHSTPILLPYSGQVAAVMVEPGQTVRAGDPLIRIASPDLVDARNALRSALAQVTAATEAVRVAQASATRQEAIYKTAGGALKDFTQAQNDLAAAQSTLRTAQSAARAASDRLAIFGKTAPEQQALAANAGSAPMTLYRAPVSGIIADRNVAPGQFIASGGSTPLMTITDPARVWLVAQLAESDAASVKLGDKVTVTTPAYPGRVFTATIDNIAAALDPNSHRLPVRATVSNPDGALKPQMFASFVIQRQLGTAGGGVLVPAKAVVHEGDSARVWVIAGKDLLRARQVQTADTEGGLTRVTSGLASGDKVVTSGAIFVNEAGID